MSNLQLVSPGGDPAKELGEDGLADDTVEREEEVGVDGDDAVGEDLLAGIDHEVEGAGLGELQLAHFLLSLNLTGQGLSSSIVIITIIIVLIIVIIIILVVNIIIVIVINVVIIVIFIIIVVIIIVIIIITTIILILLILIIITLILIIIVIMLMLELSLVRMCPTRGELTLKMSWYLSLSNCFPSSG